MDKHLFQITLVTTLYVEANTLQEAVDAVKKDPRTVSVGKAEVVLEKTEEHKPDFGVGSGGELITPTK